MLWLLLLLLLLRLQRSSRKYILSRIMVLDDTTRTLDVLEMKRLLHRCNLSIRYWLVGSNVVGVLNLLWITLIGSFMRCG